MQEDNLTPDQEKRLKKLGFVLDLPQEVLPVAEKVLTLEDDLEVVKEQTNEAITKAVEDMGAADSELSKKIDTVIPDFLKEKGPIPVEIQGLEQIHVQGKEGVRGQKGDKGDKGDRGPQGKEGKEGKQGKKGDTGDKGEKGDKGNAGRDGKDGIDGKEGKDGREITPDQIVSKLNGTESTVELKVLKGWNDYERIIKANASVPKKGEFNPTMGPSFSDLAAIGKRIDNLSTTGGLTQVYADSPLSGLGTSASHLTVDLSSKQDALISGTNIKTVNSTSLLGSGDIVTPQGTVTAVSVATANGVSGSSSGGATPSLTISLGAITPSSVNSVVLSGSATPTLSVTGTTSVAGSNTGDQDLSGKANTNQTMYIGTTSVAINRGSASLALTGITSVDGSSASCTGNSATVTGFSPTAGKTLTLQNSLTFSGTDSSSVAFGTGGTVIYSGGALGTPSSGTLTSCSGLPVSGITASTSTALGVGSIELGHASDTTIARVSTGVASVEGATIATLSTAQTWTATQTQKAELFTNNAIAASGNTATVPITYRLNTVTNNSAATLTITMTTTSATDGQLTMVRILDSSAAAQTITWVNTENSTVSAPTTSNGSTTLFLTVGFIYNGGTSKWRCIASA